MPFTQHFVKSAIDSFLWYKATLVLVWRFPAAQLTNNILRFCFWIRWVPLNQGFENNSCENSWYESFTNAPENHGCHLSGSLEILKKWSLLNSLEPTWLNPLLQPLIYSMSWVDLQQIEYLQAKLSDRLSLHFPSPSSYYLWLYYGHACC